MQHAYQILDPDYKITLENLSKKHPKSKFVKHQK